MPKLISMVVLVLSIVLLIPTGLVLASQDSVPGQVMYPVKRSLEQTILTVAGITPWTKAYFQVDLSKRRFNEATKLLASGQSASKSLEELLTKTSEAATDINRVSSLEDRRRLAAALSEQIKEYTVSLDSYQQQTSASFAPTITNTEQFPRQPSSTTQPTPSITPRQSSTPQVQPSQPSQPAQTPTQPQPQPQVQPQPTAPTGATGGRTLTQEELELIARIKAALEELEREKLNPIKQSSQSVQPVDQLAAASPPPPSNNGPLLRVNAKKSAIVATGSADPEATPTATPTPFATATISPAPSASPATNTASCNSANVATLSWDISPFTGTKTVASYKVVIIGPAGAQVLNTITSSTQVSLTAGSYSGWGVQAEYNDGTVSPEQTFTGFSCPGS